MTAPAPSRLLVLFTIGIVLLFAGCGKKGAPSLKSYEKPAAPAELSVFDRESNIYLRWSYPKDKEFTVARILILRSSGEGFVGIGATKSSERTFVDDAVAAGRKYRYKVIAQNQRGVFSNDSNVAVIDAGAVPFPPHGVSFRVNDSSVQLRWQEAGKGLLYNVYKTTTPGPYGLTPVNAEPLSSPLFIDTFDRSRSVRYTVRALTDKATRNEGPASEEIIVDPDLFVPGPVRGLRIFSSENRMYLSWDEPSETWVSGFRVYRRTRDGDYRLIGQPQTPAFIDHDASPDERDYRVHAVGPRLEGPGVEITGLRLNRNP
ncbi:MAG: hypothetical protein M0024_12925 [Nitrospiraceae bacterium]|nr:hypothetical protein [Nitrospiraceae bacterium]